MTDLRKYDKRYTVEPQGLINLGATCYFNSLLQCLLSCSSLFETLYEYRDDERIKNNDLTRELLGLFVNSKNGIKIYDKCIPFWRTIIAISQKRLDKVKMDSGQQDAHEGLMMFADTLDTAPMIKRLFEHRHLTRIYCPECNKWVSEKRETNLVFEMQANLQNEQLEQFRDLEAKFNTKPTDAKQDTMLFNDFMANQTGYIDKDYICPNKECGKRGNKFKRTVITMLPEILCIALKKYGSKMNTPFPLYLRFPIASKNNIKRYFVYQLVAQSEHAGGMSGGHYWAICARSSGWYCLNDGSVAPSEPGPTINSYIVFYHFLGVE